MSATAEALKTYTSWALVPNHLKTKTQLKEMGLKPENEDDPAAQFYSHYYSRRYNLYDTSKCVALKQRTINIKELPLTDENIAEALYIINKSAKKSRDTKNAKYWKRDYATVSRAKTRQSKLYQLKDEVISKLMKEQRVEIKGYHVQETEYGKRYLLLIEFAGFSFHMPMLQSEAEQYEYLGEISIISAEVTRKTNIKFNEAVNLLERYLEQYKTISNTNKLAY